MGNPWQGALYILFPVPLLALILLSLPIDCLPIPAAWKPKTKHLCLQLVDRIIFLRLIGKLTVHKILTIFSLILFLMSYWDKSNKERLENAADSFAGIQTFRCERWRSERNVWISLFSLVLWLVLFRVKGLMREIEKLQEQISSSQTTAEAIDTTNQTTETKETKDVKETKAD